MNKFTSSFLCLFFVLSNSVFAQESTPIGKGYVDVVELLHSSSDFDVNYPECLIKKELGLVHFKDCPYINGTWFGALNRLGYSLDNEYMVMIYGPYTRTVSDSASLENVRLKNQVLIEMIEGQSMTPSIPINNMFTGLYRRIVAYNLGVDEDLVTRKDVDKFIDLKSAEYAKRAYNADSVAVLDYWPKIEQKKLLDKYIGSKVIIFQKQKDYGVLYGGIICFYSEKGKDGLDTFMQELEGIIRFKD